MASKVFVMSLLTIALTIIPFEEAKMIQQYEEFPAATPVIIDLCPTLGTAEYQVTVMGSNPTEIGGCAFIDLKKSDPINKVFSLWLGSLNHGTPRCRENDMEHLRFSCLPDTPLPSNDGSKESLYVQIYGRLAKKDTKPKIRCAMYEMGKGNSTQFMMAVSGDNSCHGLTDILSQPQPMIPDDTILMQLNKVKHQPRFRRSQSNPEDTD